MYVGNPVFGCKPPFGTEPMGSSENVMRFVLLKAYNKTVDTKSCMSVMTFACWKSYRESAVLLKHSKATAHAMYEKATALHVNGDGLFFEMFPSINPTPEDGFFLCSIII